MQYYFVWVRSDRYRGREPLTYTSPDVLAVGTIVRVPLRSEQVLGFVTGTTRKPAFAVKSVVEALDLPPLTASNVALAAWLQAFYAAPIGSVAGLFLPPKITMPDQLPAFTPEPPLKVAASGSSWTAEQKQALQIIAKPDTYLIHGRTGSGKTRIYIELTRRAIQNNQSALILSPEIGLTSQLANEFRKSFGDRVLILHSQLTAKQRLGIWLTVLNTTAPLVVIGPRSSLFSPIHNLGLIVVDEAHENAYKQEQAPYYQALRVAAQLRQLTGSTLVLGSATPAVGDYYLAEERHKPIIRLAKLARKSTQTSNELTVVDLKDRTQFSRSPHLSNALIQAVAGSLGRGEQSLLFLNRRGTARVTLCDVCGWQALCPHCDLPLTYHGDAYRLRCHTCDYNQVPVISCPVCGNPSITLKSFGTKAIVEEIQHLFPDARVQRFDTDNTKAERLEQQYERIAQGEVDILVGTQLIAKGLDLPHLSTLGIVLADSSLYLPDFTARERTYQLLTQVMGRVGRGHISSQTIVQTYYPDSPLIQAAAQDDWQTFYASELTERKLYSFPPFCHLLRLSCRRASSQSAERNAKALQQKLLNLGLPITVDGPVPAFHEKIAGKYQWQLIVKAHNRSHLLRVVDSLKGDWSYDLDPSDLL